MKSDKKLADRAFQIIKAYGTKAAPISRSDIRAQLPGVNMTTISPTLTDLIRTERFIHREKQNLNGKPGNGEFVYWYDDTSTNPEYGNKEKYKKKLAEAVDLLNLNRTKNRVEVSILVGNTRVNLSAIEAREVYQNLKEMYGD